jgi:hypothetical protein
MTTLVRRSLKIGMWTVIVLLLLVVSIGVAHPQLLKLFEKPSGQFAPGQAPPAPDYAHQDAWLAFPGRGGLERSTPPGTTAIDEARAPVDVFFIHPTTLSGNGVWNAAYDAPDTTAPLNPVVLLGQASVFNECCRIYAPHYRQASVYALKNTGAVDVAYADVARAFRYYIEHENHGRPFIIASHSQGTVHAGRLLQQEVLGKSIQQQLVAAYLMGSAIPARYPQVGLPVCDDARQTGCLIAWNTAQAGASWARKIMGSGGYWWKGEWRSNDHVELLCVNPLNWRMTGSAPATANAGALPFPTPPFASGPVRFAPLVPNVTGAACVKGMLEVDVPWSSPFRDKLSKLVGSYHLNDYGLFYAAIRQNAVDRVDAWMAAHPRKPAP